MKRPSTMTIGCDLGDKKSHLCEVDKAGGVVRRVRISTTKVGIQKFFANRSRALVVLEVGTHSPWVSALLKELGHEVLVANPRQVRLIYAGNTKNDRFDAEVLARLARVDRKLLSEVTHRGAKARQDLAVLRSRDALVRSRTLLVNHVRCTVKSFGHRLPSGWSTAAFAKKARMEIPDELKRALNPVLAQLEQTTALIRAYDKQLEEIAHREYPETALLTEVDGIGTLTALAFVLTLEAPERFPSSRQVGAYLGLVPRQDQSGGRDPQLRITKAGDGYVRRLLVGSAHRILGRFGKESDLRDFGLRICERGGKNAKKRAVIAVARKLAVLLHAIWKKQKPYVAAGYLASAA